MDRTPHEAHHVAVVDAWLERSIDQGSSAEIARRFRAAFERLWSCAVTTLGSVTLIAITERVLHTTTTRHPLFSVVNTRPNGDAQWKQHLEERLSLVPKHELLDGARFALIELLRVIGRLTAEILTEELHAALMTVTASEAQAGNSTAHDAAPGVSARKAQP